MLSQVEAAGEQPRRGRRHARNKPLRIALLHDWLVTHRGGESVLLEIARLFPQAPIFTLVAEPANLPSELANRHIVTSWLQKLPHGSKRFRYALPLFWQACQQWPLQEYDLLLSTSHCVAHSVPLQPYQQHLAYIHTPMRYLWDEMAAYLPGPLQAGIGLQAARLALWPWQQWDRYVSKRPTQLVANSGFVAQRIGQCWQRPAQVLYPPVDVAFFAQAERVACPQGLVAVAALVPYKRLDMAIAFAQRCNMALTIVGQGPQLQQLQAMAAGRVRFVPYLPPSQLRALYGQSLAFLHCGREDFGIAPVEAMAAGCPVLALGAGGLCETVCQQGANQTGRLFSNLSLEAMDVAWRALQQAVVQGHICAAGMRNHVQQFARQAFVTGYQQFVQQMVGDRAHVTSS